MLAPALMSSHIARRVVFAALLVATSASTEAQQKPPSPTRPVPISEIETMRGRTAMAVSIVVDRQLWPDLEVSLRQALQRRLNALGIKILSDGSYPQLRLVASGVTGTLTYGDSQREDMKAFSINLDLAQILVFPGSSDAAVAATWARGRMGFGGALALRGLAQQSVDQMLDAFEADWVSVNPLKRTAVTEKPATGNATYTPSVKGRYYEYTDVPEAFVPPLPDARYPVITMSGKRQAGSLIEMSIKPVDPVTISMAGGGAINNHQNTEYWAPLIEDLKVVAQSAGILYCKYLDEPRTGTGAASAVHYFYWFKERPAIADAQRLKTRIPEHPLLVFRPALDACPPDGGTARRLR